MAARRHYIWRYRPNVEPYPYELQKQDADRAREFLLERCDEEPQFYADPLVEASVYGWVEIHLTVSAKDRWKVPWRVRRHLVPALLRAMRAHRDGLVEVNAVKLPPHQHPNRAARWRRA